MSVNKRPFPDPPFTASVYFNYASFIDKSIDGNLAHAPHLIETMNVLAGNGKESELFSQRTVDFFAEMNAITAVASDEPINDFLTLFSPKKGKGLYAPSGGVFLQSKPDLRFAVEDTIEGIITSQKAGREVIAIYSPSPKSTMRKAMRELTDFSTPRIQDIPEMVQQHINYNYYMAWKSRTGKYDFLKRLDAQ